MSRPTDRRAWLLALLFLVVVGPWVKDMTAQPASRLALTAAIVDEGTIRVDGYESILGIDRVERDGHLYSDKAPGQPVLAAPFYAAARAVGAEPATVPRERGNLTLWWVTFWSAAVPGAILVALTVRVTGATRWGLAAAAGMTFATLVLPFSSELYAHVLATALTIGAWVLLGEPRSNRRAISAGLLMGLAVLVEYQMVLAVAVLGGFVLVRAGWRRAAAFGLGAVPAGVLLLAYQAAAFGGPFRSSYGEKPVHEEGGPAIVGVPDPLQALEVLFGTRGLLIFTPVVGLAVFGTVRLARAGSERQRDTALVGLALFVVFWALQAGWPNPWGGEMPGPRYLIPALPLLAPGLAAILPSAGVLGRGAVIWSAVVMTLPMITVHLVPAGGATGSQQVHYLREGRLAQTTWTMAFGGAGWVLYPVTIALVVAWLHRTLRVDDEALEGSET